VDKPFVASQADLDILKDTDPDFRVLNLSVDAFNDASTSWFHKCIGGYHGAKLRRYQELITNQISKNNMAVLNMLNTRYVIIPDNNKQPVAQYNPDALGHAWYVRGYKLVDNADQEMAALNQFQPADTAIIDRAFGNYLSGYSPGRDSASIIRLEKYQPNALTYYCYTRRDELAVFSEIYYPKGWIAYIDGKPAPHFRANYILRAMIVPAGEHQIEFRFEPPLYYTGEKISYASSGILILVILAFVFLELRKARQRKT
jgi:hypothetical protein